MWERLFGVTALVITFIDCIVILIQHRRQSKKFGVVDFIAIGATGLAAAWLVIAPGEHILWITIVLLLFLSSIMEWRNR